MYDDEELVRDFLTESTESLDQLDRDLVALERAPGDRTLLGAVFRNVHTIKGSTGFFGFARLERLTHTGETLLARLRDGELTLDERMTTALLAMVDAIRRVLGSIETSGREGDDDHAGLVATLATLASSTDTARGADVEGRSPARPVETKVTSPADTIRVNVGLLDRVVNLVGELVLVRNQLLQAGVVLEDGTLAKISQRVDALTTELQESVLKARMQPIGHAFATFPRVVRDLAHASGKAIELVIEGAETELDRTVLEAIKDPISHAVRNAVDHGLETPDRRAATGKPPAGRLSLRARHDAGLVVVEILDDGAGLDLTRIRTRAVERGILSATEARAMGDREVSQLIFHPGFSTADRITNVSGRGVGMDVVKTNVESIGGSVDLETRAGHGTTVTFRIPLTLAIVPALSIKTRSERFAIPQVNVLEVVSVDREAAATKFDRVQDSTLYRLREKLLPVVFLDRALELTGPDDAGDVQYIVVVQAGGRQFGLVVADIGDTEDIMVKPLGPVLERVESLGIFAGATLMGDGAIALVLDVLGMARRAGVLSAAEEAVKAVSALPTATTDAAESFLVFQAGRSDRIAMPMEMVSRLEEIRREDIERAAGRQVVQHRGRILPLIDLGAELDGAPAIRDGKDTLPVILYAQGDRCIGLIVEQVCDVVDETLAVRHPIARSGMAGVAVIQGKVTDLLDVEGVIRRIDPDFFTRRAA